MYIIVGLGNPGSKYSGTRHNIGFEAIDYLAQKHHIQVKKHKHKALIGEGTIGSEKVVLVKPQTYMNLSGESVVGLLHFYKVPLENLIVVYDDIDLDPGKVRIRPKGSAGTHNGMRNIIFLLKQDGFPRIRIGVGKSAVIPLEKFVLSGFKKDEIPLMEEAVIRSVEAIETWVKDDLNLAMNRYNG
ncbi:MULTISPECIES: aminoacyl-tRNA hydrolase [unclassified Fusibacter]|uniref:aminoacyl-tRNA hydrolase n=1 Tax=unclassified Fusibacter TaxID=2624464 RepID=UPI0010109E2A|nr:MULTISPECIES: aminoacyl-tRNA hydrolase [unclassified Fusibacter]MCK8059520.1 aminoacyl-tRNA hydrolase [Fusibacter sp. A2]NPE21016.1 aminoacyl-tRNA hydrolase [Fusibacter sp. A1]RXV62290.1 aminoacyl-tRNA hydrolase [Fusibacter sp. A1]